MVLLRILRTAPVLLVFLIPVRGYGQLLTKQVVTLDSIIQGWNFSGPGGAVCVVKNGKVVYNKASGLADIRKKTPVTTAVSFDLASNAKQFTAMCIALLAEAGKLSTDDNIRKFYPHLKIRDTILVRHLLDHTSGLRDASVLAVLSGKMNLRGGVRKKYNTLEYYLECMMRETDLNYPVGSEMAYNNFNYVLLGDIVEKVSGQTLAQFSDSAIFKPLGMTKTVWRYATGMKIHNEVNGYLFNGKKFKKREGWPGIIGDHNLLSTADDLVKWQTNFEQNRLGRKDPNLIRIICRSSFLTNGDSTHYGYGLWIGKYRGQPEIGHGGDDGRHTSVLKWFPGHNLHIIVLANSSRFDQTQRMAYDVADVLLDETLSQKRKQPEDFSYVSLPVEQLRPLAGNYGFIDKRGLAQVARVTFDGGKLFASRHYYAKGIEIRPVSEEHFVGTNREGEHVHLRFSTDSGRVTLTEKFRDYPERRYSMMEPKQVSLAGLPGIYENASTGARIRIRQKGNTIKARKGFLRIPLVPFGTDMFYGPANDVLFLFERDSSGKITGFKANAYDFRNFAFQKR